MRAAVFLVVMVLLAGCDKPIITIDLKGQPNILTILHPPITKEEVNK